jgi:diketogulonate reductase-like aldo/keto reductase
LTLNDGHRVPQLGFGVWQMDDATATQAVSQAIEAGYRAIDTAAIYGNEAGVGEGLRASGVARDELFVATKLWNADQGYDSTLRAFETSLKRLNLSYLDLYLIHWPLPRGERYVESFRALIRLQDEGLVRSIGVSNFQVHHLDRVIAEFGVVPAVNQIELHPDFSQRDLVDVHEGLGIVTEAWSPLAQGGALLTEPALEAIATRLGRTVAQVVLRWHIQQGFMVIPKSATTSRIRENFDVFGFVLSEEDMRHIGALEKGNRIGPHPADFE